MNALILAAGLGERMRPLTAHTPKPLLEVGGKPLIVWHLEKLAAISVREVVINTSWLAAQFPQTLGNGERWGLNIHYSYEGDTPLETGGGMLHALPLLGDAPFIAINGDIWTDHDFADLSLQVGKRAHVVAIALPAFRTPGAFEAALTALLSADGDACYTLAGIGLYHPSLLDGSSPGRFSIVPRLVQAMEDGQLSAEIFAGTWRDIGTPQRLAQLDDELRQGVLPSHRQR